MNNRITGVIDQFPSLKKLGGWARSSFNCHDERLIVRLYLDGCAISEDRVCRYRPDLKDNVGFLIDIPGDVVVTSSDLRSGRACIRVFHSSLDDSGITLPVWSNIGDPFGLVKATRIDRKFISFLSSRGLNLSFSVGSYPTWGTKFEIPVVLQCTEIGGICSFGAFSGIFGRGRGVIHNCDIGRYCSVADGYTIGLDEHPIDFLSSSMFFYMDDIHKWGSWLRAQGEVVDFQRPAFLNRGRVKIGNDVWVGANVTIRRGVSIGNGSIIGAGSIVTRDVPPYSIVGGAPAKLIRYRFDEQTIERLEMLKWWNYKIYKLNYLNFSNVTECLDILEEKIRCGEIDILEPRYISIMDLWREFEGDI